MLDIYNETFRTYGTKKIDVHKRYNDFNSAIWLNKPKNGLWASPLEGRGYYTWRNFCKDEDFTKYLPEYKNLDELKAHYRKGGLGDMKIKNFLFAILNETLKPIREKRLTLKDDEVMKMLFEGSDKARKVVAATLEKVKNAMGINYRENYKK